MNKFVVLLTNGKWLRIMGKTDDSDILKAF